jgi:hypothetical protein
MLLVIIITMLSAKLPGHSVFTENDTDVAHLPATVVLCKD